MRIGVVSTSYPDDPDDAKGHFVASEVEALLAEGHQVVLVIPSRLASPKRSESKEGSLSIVRLPHGMAFGWPGVLARLRERPLRALGVVGFVVAARRALRELGVDRIIAHWLVPSFWPIAYDAGVPIEVVIHGSDLGLLERAPRLFARAVVDLLADRATMIRCVSDQLKRRLQGLCGSKVTAERIGQNLQVAPASLGLPKLSSRAELRATLGLDARPVVLLVARLIESKRVEVALAAATLLEQVVVVVIGDGPLKQPLAERFPSVHFLGALPRTTTLGWIKAADVVVSASLLEGAPTVVREARALGTPVVAVEAGDLRAWAAKDPGLVVLPRPAR